MTESNKTEFKTYKLKKLSYNRTNYKVEYEKDLNERQLDVVKCTDRNILVIAGAGSGKTKTLVYRMARLIEDGVSPNNILLITFTRKAANEMKKRASLILDSRCDNVTCTTFHSFANLILRRYSNFLDLKQNFTILDSADSQDIINLLRNKLVTKQQKRFAKKQTIQEIYSKSVNKCQSIEDVIEIEFPQFRDDTVKIIEILKEYVQYKREKSLCDYDDLLLYLVTLLRSNEKILNQISSQYKHILVDEYQDTNNIQVEIIELLSLCKSNIVAVGDDAQSIYSFRGANYKNILNFPCMFENTTVIKLEQNYRSSQNILDLANKVLVKMDNRYEKELFSNIEFEEKPSIVCALTASEESHFIAQKIVELSEMNNINFNDICVLARNARMTYNLEIELAKLNIPYKKFGGLKFIETVHVKDFIAYLRYILNPDDLVSLNRILLLSDGVGVKTAQKLLPIFSVLFNDNNLLPVKKRSIEELHKMIKQAKELISKPQQLAQLVISYYLPILKDKYDDNQKRQKDLEHVMYMISNYEKLEDFLSDIALEPAQISVNDVIGTNIKENEFVSLSTIHSAKGLEWKVVFVICATDGKFPSVYAFNSTDDLNEELRLLYVAITRAKRYLYITYPIDLLDSSSGMLLSKPSRFLDDIDDSILQKWILTYE